MSHRFNDSAVLAILTLLTGSLATTMALAGKALWLEAVAFVTGALCVWLVVRENVWNFPLGLVNVSAFCVVFFHARLFADAGLQVVYIVLGVIGWYLWLFGGERRTRLHVSTASRRELAIIIGVVAFLTIGLWQALSRVGGSASFADALTTALSLCAQWLLNRKRIETWFFWIAADLVYIPLYIYKTLYLTSLLYTVFLVMCLMGLRGWRASMRRDRLGETGTLSAEGAT